MTAAELREALERFELLEARALAAARAATTDAERAEAVAEAGHAVACALEILDETANAPAPGDRY